MKDYLKVKAILRSEFGWTGTDNPTIEQEELIKDTIKATKIVFKELAKDTPNDFDLGLKIRNKV